MADFYHVSIVPRPGISQDRVQKTMDLAIDWYRYHDTCWILYTSSDATKWYGRLKGLVEPDGEVFIARLNMSDHFGYMSQELWDWIVKNTSRQDYNG